MWNLIYNATYREAWLYRRFHVETCEIIYNVPNQADLIDSTAVSVVASNLEYACTEPAIVQRIRVHNLKNIHITKKGCATNVNRNRQYLIWKVRLFCYLPFHLRHKCVDGIHKSRRQLRPGLRSTLDRYPEQYRMRLDHQFYMGTTKCLLSNGLIWILTLRLIWIPSDEPQLRTVRPAMPLWKHINK